MRKMTEFALGGLTLSGLALSYWHHRKVNFYGHADDTYHDLGVRQNESLPQYLNQIVRDYACIRKVKWTHHGVVIEIDFNQLLDTSDFNFGWICSNIKWAALNSQVKIKQIMVRVK